jgi:hypothetical protein
MVVKIAKIDSINKTNFHTINKAIVTIAISTGKTLK